MSISNYGLFLMLVGVVANSLPRSLVASRPVLTSLKPNFATHLQGQQDILSNIIASVWWGKATINLRINNVGQLNVCLWYWESYFRRKKKQQVPSTFFAKTAGYWSLVEETLLVKSFLRRSSVTFICSWAAISNSTIGLFGYRFCKGEKKITSNHTNKFQGLSNESFTW